MKKKIIIIIACVLVLIGVIGVIALIKSNGSGFIYNDGISGNGIEAPKKIEGTEKYNGLLIANHQVQLIAERKIEVRATVKNGTDKMSEVQNVKLITYDAAGNVLHTIGAQIDSLEPDETKTLYGVIRGTNVAEIEKVEIK